MKEALAKVSAIQLIYEEEFTCAKILHRKGDKYFMGLKTYDSDLFVYNGITKFNSLSELANFVTKAIYISDDNKIWLAPQVRIYYQTAFFGGSVETRAFKTNEDAEKAFNEMVKKYKLNITIDE